MLEIGAEGQLLSMKDVERAFAMRFATSNRGRGVRHGETKSPECHEAGPSIIGLGGPARQAGPLLIGAAEPSRLYRRIGSPQVA